MQERFHNQCYRKMAFTIGKIAKQAGVNVETIRYYERRGLIQQPPRKSGGYRQYPLAILKRLQFIQHAKLLGLSLREIATLLNLLDNGVLDCSDTEALVENKLCEIEEKIRGLLLIKQALEEMRASCRAQVEDTSCLIESRFRAPDSNVATGLQS